MKRYPGIRTEIRNNLCTKLIPSIKKIHFYNQLNRVSWSYLVDSFTYAAEFNIAVSFNNNCYVYIFIWLRFYRFTVCLGKTYVIGRSQDYPLLQHSNPGSLNFDTNTQLILLPLEWNHLFHKNTCLYYNDYAFKDIKQCLCFVLLSRAVTPSAMLRYLCCYGIIAQY